MKRGHMVHQSPKAGRHLWCFPPIIHPRQEQMFIGSLGHIDQIHKEPSPGSTFPGTTEGGLGVFIFAAALQAQPQAKEQLLIISDWGVKVPEERGVRRNA
jgi:hypothetical protein